MGRAPRELSVSEKARAAELELGGERFVVLSVPIGVHELPESFTPAEREVCRLVLLGLTNAQIAAERRSSVRTIANQCASIYRKVGVGSRAELRAYLARAADHSE